MANKQYDWGDGQVFQINDIWQDIFKENDDDIYKNSHNLRGNNFY